jgi:hypothetical protein
MSDNTAENIRQKMRLRNEKNPFAHVAACWAVFGERLQFECCLPPNANTKRSYSAGTG